MVGNKLLGLTNLTNIVDNRGNRLAAALSFGFVFAPPPGGGTVLESSYKKQKRSQKLTLLSKFDFDMAPGL